MRFQTIMIKTIKDLFSIKRNIIFLALMIVAPFVISMIINMNFSLQAMTLANQIQTVTLFYIMLIFFWVTGILLLMFSSITCGDFITKEENDGTLLLLTSKPIYRHEIIIGKYFAFLANILLLELVALVTTPLIMYWLLPIDPAVLDSMATHIPYMFLYAVLIAVTFGALATAFSSISKSRFKTIISLVAMTLTIFLGFIMFRGYMIGMNVYDPYVVWSDVNYHMGNSYVLFLDASDFRMSPTLQAILGTVTGTYSAADPGMLYDKDLGALYPSIARTDYINPIVSFFGWIGFTTVMFFLGIIRFQKREITR